MGGLWHSVDSWTFMWEAMGAILTGFVMGIKVIYTHKGIYYNGKSNYVQLLN